MVEKSETNTRRQEAEFEEALSSGLTSSILVEMMPHDVAEHFSQKITDGDQYEDVKEMILRYVDTKADYDGNDMEVETSSSTIMISTTSTMNMMHKGKGESGEFCGYCNSCGVWDHRAADCPGKSSMQCHHWQGQVRQGLHQGQDELQGQRLQGQRHDGVERRLQRLVYARSLGSWSTGDSRRRRTARR